jgi:hypothetical protein
MNRQMIAAFNTKLYYSFKMLLNKLHPKTNFKKPKGIRRIATCG